MIEDRLYHDLKHPLCYNGAISPAPDHPLSSERGPE